MKRILLASLLAATVCLPVVRAALPGDLSGPWYNPDQSGHGLSVNIVAPDRAVVLWFVYTPDGTPLTLYVDGAVSDRRIDGIAYAPRGLRFGEFDPNTLQMPTWGEVGLEFDDCNRATLSWRADDAAYGSGAMSVVRLAGLDGVRCTLPPRNALPSGLYRGSSVAVTGATWNETAQGIVDGEGRLWGMERSLAIPGPGWVGVRVPNFVHIRPVREGDGGMDAVGVNAPLYWAMGGSVPGHQVTGQWQLAPVVSGRFTTRITSGPGGGTLAEQTWTIDPEATSRLIAPVSVSALAGSYRAELRDQFFQRHVRIDIDASGAVCLRLNIYEPEHDCDAAGKVTTPDGTIGVIDFELRMRARGPGETRYRGRGWMAADEQGDRELVLVGADDDGHGFGIAARPRND